MKQLTKEEQITLLTEAITTLGKLFQGITQSPALTFVHCESPHTHVISELKKTLAGM